MAFVALLLLALFSYRGSSAISREGQAAASDSSEGVILTLAKPEYPGPLCARQIDGRVVVQVQVDTSGRVKSVVVVRSSGIVEFDDAACSAASGSQFAVRFDRGRSVGYRVALAYEFEGRTCQAWVSSLRQSEGVLVLRPDTVRTLRVEECDEPPALLEPELSVGSGGSKSVKARVMVEADGRAGRVELISTGSSAEQDSQALFLLRAARYRPGRRGGRPARVWLVVELPGL